MTKEQALINTLARQRDEALNALAMTTAELIVAQEKIKELENATPAGKPD